MTGMSNAVQVVDAGSPGPTLGRHTGFDALEQALVECVASESRVVGADEEEVLFVLSGTGELELAGERHPLSPEAGAHLLAGERYRLHPGRPSRCASSRCASPTPSPPIATRARR